MVVGWKRRESRLGFRDQVLGVGVNQSLAERVEDRSQRRCELLAHSVIKLVLSADDLVDISVSKRYSSPSSSTSWLTSGKVMVPLASVPSSEDPDQA